MREIIFLQVGHCGNQVGIDFWETISHEHMIDPCGHFNGNCKLPIERANVYFNEGSNYKFIPRVIMTDLDSKTVALIRESSYGCIFNSDSFLVGPCGTGNIWARGRFTEGAEIMDELLDKIRIEAEKCDCMQGFQMAHSIGGGTGGGMGALLLSNLADEYPDRIINTCSIIPSPCVSESVVEPYNAILSISEMIDTTDETFCVDNEALFNICKDQLDITKPTYNDLNCIISKALSGVTTCFRFPGQLNTDLRKLYVNMVPYPKLHFFVPGFAPQQNCAQQSFTNFTVRNIIDQLFDSNNLMAACSPEDGKYLAAAVIFRGLISPKAVDEYLRIIQEKNRKWFVNYIPNCIKSAICDVPPCGYDITGTFLANTTSLKTIFKHGLDNFSSMLNRRAYIHWYVGEGMEEADFIETKKLVQDLIDDYTYQEVDNNKHPVYYDSDD